MQASRLTAVGGVLLAAAVVMINVRMDSAWSHGVLLLVTGVCFVVIFGLGFAGPLADEGARPTAEQSALLVAALVMLVAAVVRFGQVTTGNDSADSAGTITWLAAVFTLIATAAALRRRSAVCALIAAIGFGVFATEFIDWVDSGPLEAKGVRWIFFGLLIVYLLVAAALRASRPRHSAQFVNAGMLAVLAILETSGVIFGIEESGGGGFLPTWWEIVVLVAPLLALGYALWARERGPGWTGGVALTIAALAVGIPGSSGGSLLGWPLILLVPAVLALVVGIAQPRRT